MQNVKSESKSDQMSGACSRKKRRLHIVLSLDNPVQQETWSILSTAKNKTSAVCEAVCGFHRQKNLEDTLRKVLREEFKHMPVQPTIEVEAGREINEIAHDFNSGYGTAEQLRHAVRLLGDVYERIYALRKKGYIRAA